MKIELTVGETLLASFDGVGAIWAVAKAFNLYPPAPDELKNIDLIGRSHHKMLVVYSTFQKEEYLVNLLSTNPIPDIFVVVTGQLAEYVIHGYCDLSNLVEVEPENLDEHLYKIFHHTLTEFVSENYFYELIDGTRIPLRKKY